AEVDEGIALACFLRLHVIGDVEIDDRTGETCGERPDVESLDRPNTALAVAYVAPAFAHGVADGGDEPESCDYDSSLRHALGPLIRREMINVPGGLMLRSFWPGYSRSLVGLW